MVHDLEIICSNTDHFGSLTITFALAAALQSYTSIMYTNKIHFNV